LFIDLCFELAEPHQVKLEVMSLLPSTKVVQELQSVHFISGILLVVFRLKFLELSIMTRTLKLLQYELFDPFDWLSIGAHTIHC
jgi:hypothetical protein